MKSYSILVLFLSMFSAANVAVGMPGGYSPADVNDQFVVEAAKFAVQSLSQASYGFVQGSSFDDSRLEIVKASQQVVAGMNYKLTVALFDGNGNCEGAFKCTIYNHFGDFSVTTWDDEVSCEAATEWLNEKAEPES